jgi:translation initiation factor 4E
MESVTSTTSNLTGPALLASRAALTAALADQNNGGATASTDVDESLEAGEIQEVDMQAQAEGIKTVFNDPTNFNVKVGVFLRLNNAYADADLT